MSIVTLLLLLVAMGVGIFFYRRKKSKPVSENTQDEEEEEVLEEEEEEEMDAADMIAVEKKADIAIQKTKRKASVAASMAKKKKAEAEAALAAKKKAEAEAREAKRKKDAQAALIAKKKAEAAAALAAKKKAEAEAYKRKLAKAREEKRKAEEAARRLKEMPVGVDMRPGYPKRGWVNDTLNINYGKIKNQSAKQCRQHAIKMNKSKPGYVRLWGHYNSKVPNANKRNTCFFYTNNKTFTSANDPIAPKFGDRAEWTPDKRYSSGCVESGRRVTSGCKDPNAIRNEKAVYKKKLADEAARKAREEAERKRKEAARKAHEAEMKRRRDEAARKAREAKARAYRERVRLKWNRDANRNAKKKVTACDRASWNGVKLVLNGYRKVNSDQYWFSNLRRYSPRKRDGDQNITRRQMIPRTWRYNNVKMEVKTKRIRLGWRRVNSWGDTKTHIYFGRCWGFRGLNCSWRQKKTYDGHLFVDGNRLMLRKGIKFGRMPWEFYLKDVELAKFNGNRGECAIIAVSASNTRKLLFVQSNNTDESYDLTTGRWITHPYKKCLSLVEWTQKLCKNSSGKYMC